MENEITVTRKLKITDADIEDIMSSALEGGVNYWVEHITRPDGKHGEFWDQELTQGTGSLMFRVVGRTYTLTKDNFLTGLAKYLENPLYDCIDGNKIDPGNIDAECADMIVQYALFGGLVYG